MVIFWIFRLVEVVNNDEKNSKFIHMLIIHTKQTTINKQNND
jgi:hypothetical protein